MLRIKLALDRSPRQKLLQRLGQACIALYDAEPSVRAMYETLATPRDSAFLTLQQHYDALSPGAAYTAWLTQHQRSLSDDPFEDPARRATVMDGKLAKAAERGRDLPSQDELLEAVAVQQRREFFRRDGASEQAAALWPLVTQDRDYRRHACVQHTWRTWGFDALANAFQRMDANEGRERHARGGSFEQQCAENAFVLVRDMLLSDGGAAAEGLGYERGVHWVDRGKKLGEVDVVVFRRDEATHERHVVALVEMKSSCYEIYSGYLQQHAKLSNSSLVLQGDEDADAAPYVIDRNHLPPVVLATLVPALNYVLGCEITIVNLLSEYVFKTAVHQRRLDLDDDASVDDCIATIRRVAKLTLSPQYFLSQVCVGACICMEACICGDGT